MQINERMNNYSSAWPEDWSKIVASSWPLGALRIYQWSEIISSWYWLNALVPDCAWAKFTLQILTSTSISLSWKFHSNLVNFRDLSKEYREKDACIICKGTKSMNSQFFLKRKLKYQRKCLQITSQNFENFKKIHAWHVTNHCNVLLGTQRVTIPENRKPLKTTLQQIVVLR